MQDKLAQLLVSQHQPDLFVQVSRDLGGIFDFHKASEIIETGRQEFIKKYEQKSRQPKKKKREEVLASL